MLRFILYLFAFTASVFLLSAAIRYGLKGAGRWDMKICSKLGKSFTGFNWYYRIPFSIGIVPEYYFYLVIGRDNYFKTNWWALKTSGFLSFLMFLAFLTNRTEATQYFSLQTLTEGGMLTYFTSGVTFWYLNLVNLLFTAVIVLIVVESIRMHGWYAPVRIVIYTLLSALIYVLTMTVLVVIIMVTALYIAYKIIKFFMTSSRRRRQQEDDDHDVSDQLNNKFRAFRAELYAWEAERITTHSNRHEERKSEAKRKRPKIKRRKRKLKNDDIPRFHPD
jgi:ABC-type multidrug transport system fused ATPase/permease subunit